MQPTLLTYWLQLMSTRCRQSQLRFVLSPLLLHMRLGTFQSDILLLTLTWPAKHSPDQRWESAHRLHLYPSWVVSFNHHTISGCNNLWIVITICYQLSVIEWLHMATLGQHRFKLWHQVITFTNVDLPLVSYGDNHQRANSNETSYPSVTQICTEINHLKFHSDLPGTNELIP